MRKRFLVIVFLAAFLTIAIVFVKTEIEMNKEKVLIKAEIDKTIKRLSKIRKEEEYIRINMAPDSSDFNEKFALLGELLGVEIPYSFYQGGRYSQIEMNENFDVIIEALEKEIPDKNNFRFKELALLITILTDEPINIKFTTEKDKEFYTKDDIEYNLNIFIEALKKETKLYGAH